MDVGLITFEEHGFPIELIGRRDIERAISTRRLRADTIVRLHSASGDITTCHARDVPDLCALLGVAAPPPAATPPPPAVATPPAPIAADAPPARAPGLVLRKGQNLVVSSARETLAEVQLIVRCAIDPGVPVEVDFSVFILRADGRAGGDADLIFYNNDSGDGGAVRRFGPTADGALERSDCFTIRLAALSADVTRISATASIYAADARGNSFRQVPRTTIELLDPARDVAIARYDHDEAASETALILGELYRRGDEWKFRAVGQGYVGGLAAMATAYGLEVSDPPPA